MIDEKRLLEVLEKNFYGIGGVEVLKQIINEQPKVGEWIPVEKRLPEQSLNSVIGWDTYRERCVFVQYYMNEWILGNHESVNIVAWQPLPEPYKGEPK